MPGLGLHMDFCQGLSAGKKWRTIDWKSESKGQWCGRDFQDGQGLPGHHKETRFYSGLEKQCKSLMKDNNGI